MSLFVLEFFYDEKRKKERENLETEKKPLIDAIKEALKDKVNDVKISSRLVSSPVCLVSGDGVSFEMERVLKQMPNQGDIKADRILEINPNHDLFKALEKVYKDHPDKLNDYATLLFDQAMLMEGMNIENPVEFSNKMCALMIDAAK